MEKGIQCNIEIEDIKSMKDEYKNWRMKKNSVTENICNEDSIIMCTTGHARPYSMSVRQVCYEALGKQICPPLIFRT